MFFLGKYYGWLYYIWVIHIKYMFNCGYRSLRCALKFNKCSSKKVHKRLEYNDGVSMYDLKCILEDWYIVNAFEISHSSYISSNMIVHTYYRNVGHFIYVVYASSKWVFIFDSRRVFSYRIVKRQNLIKFIDYRYPVRVLKIENEINLKLIILGTCVSLVFLLFALMIDSVFDLFFYVLFLCFIKIIKKVKKVR